MSRSLPCLLRAGVAALGLTAASAFAQTAICYNCPTEWADWGTQLRAIKAKTGITIPPDNKNSGQSLAQLVAEKASPVADVTYLGVTFAIQAQKEGVVAPYKPAAWNDIPEGLKDPQGHWFTIHSGTLGFMVNVDALKGKPIPKSWADLLKPEYKGKIALPGDPRASSQAILAVFASGLANGGSLDDAAKGLDFFKQLKDNGNLIPGVIANATTVANGETPITIRWTYNALAGRDATAAAGGPEIEVVVPSSGRFGGVYVQAISAYAPHPNAAKLWQEFLYSDEGQNMWLRGYCHPIRYEDLVKNNKVPADQLAKLPDVTGTVFPTLAQLDAARTLITEQWDSVVGVSYPTPAP